MFPESGVRTMGVSTPQPTRRFIMNKNEQEFPNSDKNPKSQGGELLQLASDGHLELTTNQGIPVFDNQNSLKANARGPVLLEDFILREKIMHFDHERIPER